MKKVLFTATVDSHINCFHLPYLKYFKEHGYIVHVATNSDDSILYSNKKIKIPFSRNPFKFNNIKAIFELRKVIKEEKYDLIITNTPVGSVVTRLANKHRCKLIYIAHGFHFYKGCPLKNWFLYYPIEKYLTKYTDVLVTINKEDYNRAKSFNTRVEYIPGIGLNTNKYKTKMLFKNKIELRKKIGLKLTDYVMIYPAELNNNKNQIFLLKCMKYLSKFHIHLLLPGEDKLNGKLQKYVKKNKIKNIHFLGYRNDIYNLLQISDLSVSASKREGLPFNILEAMYVGLPIIVSDSRGNRDLVHNNGYIYKDERDFISKVELFYHQKVDIKQMSINGKKETEKYYLDKALDKMIKIYNQKRVLQVLCSNKFSGAESVAINTIKSFPDINMTYCSVDGQIKNSLGNINSILLKKFSIKNLKKAIKQYGPDIIEAHDYRASVYCALINYKCKLISHIHKNDPSVEHITIKSLLYKFCIPRFNQIVGVSKSILDSSIYKDKMKDKFKVIYNYVNKEEIIKKSKEYKYPKKYDLFFLGRLIDYKDPIRFINIYKELNKPNLKAVMIGDGPLYNECFKMIREQHLNIDLVGFVSNPFPIILNSKIGIMPSHYEGFGLSIVECIILNKPVLNSGAGGLKEVCSDDQELICISNQDYIDKINIKHKYKEIKYCDFDKWYKEVEKLYKG